MQVYIGMNQNLQSSINIKKAVHDAITKILQPDDPSKVVADCRLSEDLAADSLDVVELVMELESKTGVEISDDAAKNIKTVGDIETYIENQLIAKKS